MRSSLLFACCLAALFSTTTVFANKALPDEALPPEPKPAVGGVSEPVKLVVRKDLGAKTSRIIIPAKFIVGAGASGAKVGALSPMRSIVAGLALSAAVASVFIAVRRGKRVGAVAAVVFGAIALSAAASAIADVPVTPEERRLSEIVVEVVADGDEVVLIQGIAFGR